jgi:hypothetical protein
MRLAYGDQEGIALRRVRCRSEIEFERGHGALASIVCGEQAFSVADPSGKRFVPHDHFAFRSGNGLSWLTCIPLSPL